MIHHLLIGNGAFHEHVVLACLGSTAIAASYRRLLVMGGAKVPCDTIQCSNARNAAFQIIQHAGAPIASVEKLRELGVTLALFEPTLKSNTVVELFHMAKKAGIPCVKPSYTKDYILCVADGVLDTDR